MTVRVALRDGILVPLDPLPADWADGRELQLSEDGKNPPATDRNGASTSNAVEDIDEGVEWLTDDEYKQFQAALEEADRDAKAWMRREMGLT